MIMRKLIEAIIVVFAILMMAACSTDEIKPYVPPTDVIRGIDHTDVRGTFTMNDGCVQRAYSVEIVSDKLSHEGLVLRHLYNSRIDSLSVVEAPVGDDAFEAHEVFNILEQDVVINSRSAFVSGQILNYYDSVVITYNIAYPDVKLKVKCEGVGKKIEKSD